MQWPKYPCPSSQDPSHPLHFLLSCSFRTLKAKQRWVPESNGAPTMKKGSMSEHELRLDERNPFVVAAWTEVAREDLRLDESLIFFTYIPKSRPLQIRSKRGITSSFGWHGCHIVNFAILSVTINLSSHISPFFQPYIVQWCGDNMPSNVVCHTINLTSHISPLFRPLLFGDVGATWQNWWYASNITQNHSWQLGM